MEAEKPLAQKAMPLLTIAVISTFLLLLTGCYEKKSNQEFITEHNLKMGELSENSLSPEVQIPNHPSFNLEAKILKIFNEHQTIDYVIKDENNGNFTQARKWNDLY